MKSRFFFLTSIFLLICFASFSQNFILDNAVSLYDTGNMIGAKNQIDRAAIHPRFKLQSKTWYYYFKINKGLKNQDNLIYATLKMMDMSENDTYYIKFKNDMYIETEIFKEEPDIVTYNITDYFYFLPIFEFLGDTYNTEKLNLIIANYYFSEGNYDSSAVYYSKKSINDKIRFDNYVGMLNTLSVQRKSLDYEQVMQQAKADFPDDTRFIYFEIDRLISKKKYFKAKSEIENLLLTGVKSAELYIRLGQVNELLNRNEESVAAYRIAHLLEPESFLANFRLGMIYKEQVVRSSSDSIVSCAKKHLEKAEQLSPKDLEVLKPLEELYLDVRDIPNYTRIREVINSL